MPDEPKEIKVKVNVEVEHDLSGVFCVAIAVLIIVLLNMGSCNINSPIQAKTQQEKVQK